MITPAPRFESVSLPGGRGAEAGHAWVAELDGLAAALSAAVTPGDVLDVVADVGCPLVGADSIDISLLDEGATTFHLVTSRRSPQQVTDRFASYPADAPLPTTDAVRGGLPVLIRSRDERDARYPALAGVEVSRTAWAVLPLRLLDRTLGVVGLGWDAEQGFDPGQLGRCLRLAELAAVALDRARRFDAEQQARATAETLARRLGELQSLTVEMARATDPATVADLVCGAGLRALTADAATIGLFDGEHTVTVLAASGIPSERVARWATVDLGSSLVARTVLADGRPVMWSDPGERDRRFPELATNPSPCQAWANLPLVVDGRVLGIAAFGWGLPRTFTSDDEHFLAAVASNAAIALDRGQLLESTRQVAATLQRALLPKIIDRLDGWDLASYYYPAVEGTEVGGDWFDAFALPDGRVGLVLGDVAGKGVHAAAVMGAVRSATRAFATVDPTPRSVLTRLDAYFATFKPDELVTCLFSVLVPQTGELVYASAGQLPAIVTGPHGPRLLDGATSPPLGAGEGVARVQAGAAIDVGEVLLMYSDGLVERRDQDIDACVDTLAEAASTLPTATGLQESAQALVSRLDRPERVVDDIAVLAVRRRACGP